MKLIELPNKILNKEAKAVIFPLSKETEEIINNMINHIDSSQKKDSKKRPGIGIAAPQVGKSLQMFYVNVPENEEEGTYREFLINPEIIGYSETRKAALRDGEGCLSVPFQNKETEGLVHRYNKIIIKGYSFFSKKEKIITKVGYHAIVLQHEFDHLKGILFIDKINKKDPWKQEEGEVLI